MKKLWIATLAATMICSGSVWAAIPEGTTNGGTTVAIGEQSEATGGNATAVGFASKATGTQSAAFEQSSNASGEKTVAVGTNSKAAGEQSVVVGMDSDANGKHSTSVGYGSHANAENSVALGWGSVANEANTISVGKGGNYRKIVNVADGVAKNDAATKGQLDEEIKKVNDELKKGGIVSGTATNGSVSIGEASKAANSSVAIGKEANVASGNSVAIGNSSSVEGWNSTAIGWHSDVKGSQGVAVGQSAKSVGGRANAFGANSNALAKQSMALGSDTRATGEYSVALGNNSVATESDVISVGHRAGDQPGYDGDPAYDSDYFRRIVNMADGTVAAGSHDAITGNQLWNEQQSRISADAALGSEIDSVGAISAALAGLHPLDYGVGDSKYQLSAAVGTYDGTQALALGGFYHANRDVLLSLGVSTALSGDKKTAGNLGVTFRVGHGRSGTAIAEASSLDEANTHIAELAKENQVLSAENKKLSDRMEKLEERLAALEQSK